MDIIWQPFQLAACLSTYYCVKVAAVQYNMLLLLFPASTDNAVTLSVTQIEIIKSDLLSFDDSIHNFSYFWRLLYTFSCCGFIGKTDRTVRERERGSCCQHYILEKAIFSKTHIGLAFILLVLLLQSVFVTELEIG